MNRKLKVALLIAIKLLIYVGIVLFISYVLSVPPGGFDFYDSISITGVFVLVIGLMSITNSSHFPKGRNRYVNLYLESEAHKIEDELRRKNKTSGMAFIFSPKSIELILLGIITIVIGIGLYYLK